jgi:hypothetical protein
MGPSNDDIFDDGPGWRWSRIQYIIKNALPPPRRATDPLIRRGYQYLKRRNGILQNPGDEHWVRADYPDLFAAHNLYQNTSSERWIVEAGVLADQTPEFLADYTATRPEVVRAYEAYFFDIRDKLKAPGYIITRLLRPALRGTAKDEVDLMVKLAAWVGGWRLVQDTIDARHLSVESVGWLKTAFVHELVKKGWLAVRRIDVNNFTASELIGHVLRLAELEQSAKQMELAQKGEQVKDNEIYTGLQALLNSVQTGILRPEKVVGDEERAMAALEVNIHAENG